MLPKFRNPNLQSYNNSLQSYHHFNPNKLKILLQIQAGKWRMKKEVIQDQPSNNNLSADSGRKKETTTEKTQVGFFQLFRFATKIDYLLMIVGTLCACAMGTAVPFLTILWGDVTDNFANTSQTVGATKNVMLNLFKIGAGTIVAGWGMFGCWIVTAERQGIACRQHYLRSLLRQEIGWFDTINQSELASNFATDSFAFQGAIGEKVSSLIMTLSTFASGLIIAFINGWLMALVITTSLPAIAFGGYLYSFTISKKDSELENQYSEAGGLAAQAISAIKTVKQMNGEQFQADRYSAKLTKVTKNATKYGVYIGIGIGALYGAIFCTYGLAFWFGSNCVQGNSSCPPSLNNGHPYTAGKVLIILFCILEVGYNFLQIVPALGNISEGRTAAARIFQIVDRQPLVVSPTYSIKPETFKGVFCFEGVTFAYPKDPNNPKISNLTLKIDSNSTAFVGQSGCGKSTIFQLMMRFYDPKEGRITLDGVDLRELDLQWLRRQIGYVGQEPVLFSGTIRQNLLLGKEDANQEEIDAALRKAEAYDFVYALKEKLDSLVGASGSQISGGQKQRLAIARVLLKDPKILLLDEATSALDRRNEKNIQNTLNRIAADKPTITIAHSIKTIMNCKEIIVIDKGSLKQIGSFTQLQRFRGIRFDAQEEQLSNLNDVNQNPIGDKIQNQSQNPENPEEIAQADKVDEQAIQLQQKQEQLEKYQSSVYKRLFSYSMHRKGYFVVGIIVCILNGMIFPLLSTILAKMLVILINYSNDPNARSDSNHYALLFVILGILYFLFCIIQQVIFTTIGEEITEKVRNQMYLKILKMPISWFERSNNHGSVLSTRLASQCKAINGITTTHIAMLVQNISNLLTGLIIALVYQWHTALVALGLFPLMIAAGAIQAMMAGGFSAQNTQAYKDSTALIAESMISIRTIRSLTHETLILQKYSQKLKPSLEISIKKGNLSGIFFGFSQCILYVIAGIVFHLGAIFIHSHNISVYDVFTATYAIIFAGVTIGNNAHFMPDIEAAKISAVNIFSTLDAEDEDQLQVKSQSKLLKTPIKGRIEFKNVDFKYESRNDYVLRNLNLDIREGLKVGFVGASGCGKSTIHQLLLRFYDPCAGEILIDGVSIADYDVHHLRDSLGLVSQEPTLFNDTIGNNIKYNRDPTFLEEIVWAANESNYNPQLEKEEVGENITEMRAAVEGEGFERNVGVKGSHISGGQKQRVAIARMIIRRPNVLLLDEATSALDSTNERKVQDSLDRLMEGKTSIIIAHRIDTIKNSDFILLFNQGVVEEKGTYQELISLKGKFYSLQKGHAYG